MYCVALFFLLFLDRLLLFRLHGAQNSTLAGFLGVFFHVRLIPGGADQYCGTLHTTALTGHALQKVDPADALGELHQLHLTLGKALVDSRS